MDSGACADLCDKPKDESIGTTVQLNNDVPPDPEYLVPITPDTIRENGDFPIDFHSPLTLTVVRKQLKLASIDSANGIGSASNLAFVDIDDGSTPRTPKDAVFDPFAPGPDNMARLRLPHYKKYLDELRISVARRIDFDEIQHQNSLQDEESLSDQDMFELVYESLLQVIVSKQTEGVLAQMSNVEYDEDDCKTPAFPLRITGISDTCPGAPLKTKPGGKPRNIQVELCKKLEF